MGAIGAGTTLAWTSPVLPQLIPTPNTTSSANVTFQLTESQGGTVGSMLALGALVAALPAGYVAEKIGRKKAILTFIIPFLIQWLLIVFAQNAETIYVGRLFAGVATGAMCVICPMYIGEIASAEIRGALGSFFQMFLCIGILLTYFLGSLVTWRYLSGLLAIVPVLFALLFFLMPETPTYLLKIGDGDAAEKSLTYFRGISYNVERELKEIQKSIEEAKEKSAGVKDLVASRANRKALLSSFGLMVFQQLSGVNAVIFYTVPIFKSAGSSLAPDVAAIIVAVVQVAIAYAAAMLIEKAGRRYFLITSSTGMLLCLTALGMYFHLQKLQISFAGLGILPLASLVLYIVAFSLGFGPVPWMIMGELFAPEIKGVASGLAVMMNWFLVFVVTFSFPIMNSSLGGHATFYIFAVIMAIGTAFVYFVVPETRGKSLQEIQEILSN